MFVAPKDEGGIDSFIPLPVQDPFAVGISSYEFRVTNRVKLAHYGMALGNVRRFPFGVMAVELQDGGCLGTIVYPSPANGRNTLQRAVEKDAFGMGIVLAAVVRKTADFGFI